MMVSAKSTNENNTKFLIQFFGIFTALFTPFAYLIGLAYYQGYMAAFGVSSDIFPKATADIYVDAYVAIGSMMLDLIGLPAKLAVTREFYFGLLILCVGMYLTFKFIHFLSGVKLSDKFNGHVLKVLAYLHYKNNDLTKAIAYISIPTYFIMLLCY